MDFLEKLYSNENFGIYLVVVIAILVILFFIVLFLGKKDEKKVKQPKSIEPKPPISDEPMVLNNNIEQPKEVVEQPVILQPVIEPTNPAPVNEQNILKSEPVVFQPVEPPVVSPFKEITEPEPLEVNIPKEEPKVEPNRNIVLNETVEEEPIPEVEHKEFDFDALAAAINKELESINENKTYEEPKYEEPKVEEPKKPVIEEKPFSFPTFETVEPDKIPEPLMKEESAEVKPVIEEKPRTVMPNVFSSVYVNREEPKKEEPKPMPKHVAFELPKMADLPKKVEPKEDVEIHSVLDSIEGESYRIDK